MFGTEKLDNAYNDAIMIVNFKGGFDTFSLRQGFEHDFSLSTADKNELLDYLKDKAPQGGSIYQKVKAQIDDQEFLSTDYYVNPFPRRFKGAYSPVVYKTLGGVMAMSLHESQSNNFRYSSNV